MGLLGTSKGEATYGRNAQYNNLNQPYSTTLTSYGNQSREPGLAAQQDALSMFRQGAMGQGPSVAQQMLAQQSQQAQRQNMAMMQGARGGNLAGAYQQALGANSGQQAMLGQNAAILRAQEQLAAQQAYAGLGTQLYGQGMGYDQMAINHLNQGAQNAINWNLGQRGMDLQAQQQRFGQGAELAKTIMGGASAVGQMIGGAMSDVRAKEDMMPVSAADAAAQVQPLAYRYKPGMGQPQGQQIGVSAQQLQETPLGSTLVGQGPNGMLSVDGGRAGIAALAASGENARRLRMIEQGLARLDPNASGDLLYGTAEEGARNTALARRLSDDIASQRGRAQVARGNYGGQPSPALAGRVQISRGSQPTADPFDEPLARRLAARTRYFPELAL